MKYPKRLIEVDLPIARISAHARREKSIRHGHISTLHIWWARRPLAACRAVICAALWPDPADEYCPMGFREAAVEQIKQFANRVLPKKITAEGRLLSSEKHCSPESRVRWEAIAAGTLRLDANEPADLPILRLCLLDFIADFANWDNSTMPAYLETSRTLTQAAHEALGGVPGTRPLVVDPFAGGGSIPLEASRVGAEAYASDLNPVPVVLNKVLLEIIPKYGYALGEAFAERAEWVTRECERQLGELYPPGVDGSNSAAYIWARTILSEAPGEQDVPIEVPLIRSLWLSKKGQKFALRWVRDKMGKIETRVVEKAFANGRTLKVRQPLLEVFEPNNNSEVETGTSSGGGATCPITQFTTTVESVRKQLSQRSGGTPDARLICVVAMQPNKTGRYFRAPEESDLAAVQATEAKLSALQSSNGDASLLPDGELNHLRGFFNVVLYGMTHWGDLFCPRQQVALLTLVRLIDEAVNEIADKQFRNAVKTCLALAVDRCADKCAALVVWDVTRDNATHVFGRQALPMVWDFAEVSLLSTNGWTGACEWIRKVIEANANANLVPGTSCAASATDQPLPDESVAATITDPPYYAAIPYADLSDFFYSWLRRTIGDVFPDLFSDELAPKELECVSLSHRAAMYRHKDNAWFESTMQRACADSRRVTRHDGIAVYVFANKETEGWEAMLLALISAGWVVTASWPIDTEMSNRLRAQNSAVLASSVHLVCRPRENPDGSLREEIGEWRDVLSELPNRIHEWMPRLAAEGVVGADAIFACLGPALEVFSRYSRVEKASGEAVPLREYLEQVWSAVSTEALSMIFKDADAAGLEPDARLTAMWLWTLGANADEASGQPSNDKVTASTGYTLEFDAARKIAQGLGIHLEQSESIVEVKGDKARMLPVSERTRYLFGKDETTAARVREHKKKKEQQQSLFVELDELEAEAKAVASELRPEAGATVLDRVHQSMILFSAGRGEALRRFLVDDGIGTDARFWKLAQALSALYPKDTDEKRWVDGVLARKKGLGL